MDDRCAELSGCRASPFLTDRSDYLLIDPPLDMRKVQHRANPLQDAFGCIRDGQPDRLKCISNGRAIDLIDRCLSSQRKYMIFKAAQPGSMPPILPAATKRFIAGMRRLFEIGNCFIGSFACSSGINAGTKLPRTSPATRRAQSARRPGTSPTQNPAAVLETVCAGSRSARPSSPTTRYKP